MPVGAVIQQFLEALGRQAKAEALGPDYALKEADLGLRRQQEGRAQAESGQRLEAGNLAIQGTQREYSEKVRVARLLHPEAKSDEEAITLTTADVAKLGSRKEEQGIATSKAQEAYYLGQGRQGAQVSRSPWQGPGGQIFNLTDDEANQKLQAGEKIRPYQAPAQNSNTILPIVVAGEGGLPTIFDRRSRQQLMVKDGKLVNAGDQPQVDASSVPGGVQPTGAPGASAGSPARPPIPAAAQNQILAYKRALPALDEIVKLSGAIKTGEGLRATASGTLQGLESKVNLNDPVALYRSRLEGFAPLIARLVGHTGVLTEKDVGRTESLFGNVTDSDTLRATKTRRAAALIRSLANVDPYAVFGEPVNDPDPDVQSADFARRLSTLSNLPIQDAGQGGPNLNDLRSKYNY